MLLTLLIEVFISLIVQRYVANQEMVFDMFEYDMFDMIQWFSGCNYIYGNQDCYSWRPS